MYAACEHSTAEICVMAPRDGCINALDVRYLLLAVMISTCIGRFQDIWWIYLMHKAA